VPLRRADRLFDIIRILRAASQPVTAAAIADELEVTVRTVYRDVATLQARRIPIEGAAGVGYVLRRGYELPPLMFTEDEAEAIAVGVRLLARTGDPGLQKAAKSVLSKVTLVVPDPLRDSLWRQSMSRRAARRFLHSQNCHRRSAARSALHARCASPIRTATGAARSG
jgi:predicted DNA-binding transcriptional regulator YafY